MKYYGNRFEGKSCWAKIKKKKVFKNEIFEGMTRGIKIPKRNPGKEPHGSMKVRDSHVNIRCLRERFWMGSPTNHGKSLPLSPRNIHSSLGMRSTVTGHFPLRANAAFLFGYCFNSHKGETENERWSTGKDWQKLTCVFWGKMFLFL